MPCRPMAASATPSKSSRRNGSCQCWLPPPPDPVFKAKHCSGGPATVLPFSMKPSARIQSTIELLEKISSSRVPMDATTGDYMRGRRYIGSKDRADIAERVYNVARARARLGWWLEEKSMTDSPRARVIAWLALGEGKDAAGIENLFDATQHAPVALTEEEKQFASALPVNGLIAP